MSRSRTNNLHRKLPPEVRDQVVRDLIQKPPGRASVREICDHYDLENLYGVKHGTVEQYNTYLQQLVENRRIHELAWAIQEGLPERDLSKVLKARFLEMATRPELDLNDACKLASAVLSTESAERASVEKNIRRQEWKLKRSAMLKEAKEIGQKNGDGKLDAGQVADLIDRYMRGEAIHA